MKSSTAQLIQIPVRNLIRLPALPKLVWLCLLGSLACAGAHATPFGEPFNPAKFTLYEAATGATTASYGLSSPVDVVLVISGSSGSAKALGSFVIYSNCLLPTLAVMWDSAAGNNHRTYACDLSPTNVINGGAGGSLVVVKRDDGGSIQGVLPIYTPSRIAMMQVGKVVSAYSGATVANNCVSTGNAASLNTPSHICGSTVPLFPDAGVSDLEPLMFADPVNGGVGFEAVYSTTVTTKQLFQQVMGVAVNLKLYRALQATQSFAQDDFEGNRPSLPPDFIASALLGNLSSSQTARRGWGLVVSAAADANVVTKQINICRGIEGSGAQAASNAYFAGQCGSGRINPLTYQGAVGVTGTTTAVVESSSSGASENCLMNVDLATGAPDNNAYGLGIVSRNSDPFSPTDKRYRFVKLNGLHPEAHTDRTTGKCDTTRNFPGCADAQLGKYDFVYESTMQWNSLTPGNASKLAWLQNISKKAFVPPQLQLGDAAANAGLMALSTSYSGAYDNLALGNASQVYGSRVSRGTNSCSPLTVRR